MENASQKKTYAKALEIMAEAKREGGRTVPVYRGADKPGQTSETPASKFIRDSVLAHPGEITIIAIGPLTNLAAAINSDPKVARSIKHVVSMGGALKVRLLGLPPGAFDMNWGSDQAATQLVIQSVPEFVMISSDICTQTVFTSARYKKLNADAPFLREYIAQSIKPWLNFNRMVFHSKDGAGFYPWDTLAVEYVLQPEIFKPNPIQITTRYRGPKALYIDIGRGAAINAPLEMNIDQFWKLFFDRV
jgi:inosine-uridine nucleoside N-ribohydrolase